MPELSVVLPAYLEEENLRILLPRLNKVLKKLDVDGEIVVVDTVSPLDQTADACRENSARYVARRGGNSFGDAVRTGIAEARGRYTVFMDADGSHAPEFIPELFSRRTLADVVIASRYVEGGYTENSFLLVLMSRVVNIAYSVVLGLKCKDVSNSFKIYRTEDLQQLKLTCSNFDIVEEILLKLSRGIPGFRALEIPFSFKKRMFGETKRDLVKFILTYIGTMVRLKMSVIGQGAIFRRIAGRDRRSKPVSDNVSHRI